MQSQGVNLISDKGIDFLKMLEGHVMLGDKHVVYDDDNGNPIQEGFAVVGFPTIGHGHLLTRSERNSGYLYIYDKKVSWLEGISDEDAEELLDFDLDRTETAVYEAVTVPLQEHQLDALIVFAFNVGVSAFKSSTLLKVLNKTLYEEVPAQMSRWVYTNKKFSQGLANRREKTGRLFSTGQYA